MLNPIEVNDHVHISWTFDWLHLFRKFITTKSEKHQVYFRISVCHFASDCEIRLLGVLSVFGSQNKYDTMSAWNEPIRFVSVVVQYLLWQFSVMVQVVHFWSGYSKNRTDKSNLTWLIVNLSCQTFKSVQFVDWKNNFLNFTETVHQLNTKQSMLWWYDIV